MTEAILSGVEETPPSKAYCGRCDQPLLESGPGWRSLTIGDQLKAVCQRCVGELEARVRESLSLEKEAADGD